MLRRCTFIRAPLAAMTAAEVEAKLAASKELAGWSLKTEPKRLCIEREFQFKDFDAAWAWMGRVVPALQKADHHPEWFNVYNKVRVVMSTHDAAPAGGVTDKDFNIAAAMNRAVAEE